MRSQSNRQLLTAVLISACLVAALSPATAGEVDEPRPTPKVNINTATEQELSYLPGVGPKTAAAIIRYRARRPFRKSSDIIRVKGIGRKTYKKLRPFLVVAGPTTAHAKIRLKQ